MRGLISLFLAWSSVAFGFVVHAQHEKIFKPHNHERKLSVGFILFPGYEPLDVHGTLELIYTVCELALFAGVIFRIDEDELTRYPLLQLSFHFAIELAMIAKQKGPVSARPPGGRGTQALEDAGDTSVEHSLSQRSCQVKYILSVCTGAVSLPKAGLLDGRKVTMNKSAWKWAVTHGENVTWIPTARWTADGRIWTSSGVSAGMNMIASFFKMFYGEHEGVVEDALNEMEYAPNTSPTDDPFSVVLKVPGASLAQMKSSTSQSAFDLLDTREAVVWAP